VSPAASGTYSITRGREPAEPPPNRTRDWPAPPAGERKKEPSQPPIGRIKLVSIPAQSPEADVRVEEVPVTPPPRPSSSLEPDDETGFVSVTNPKISSGPIGIPPRESEPHHDVSVVISGTEAETATALAAAAAFADRDRLFAARRAPDDPAMLLAVLTGDASRRRLDILEDAARASSGRTLAIALHELALLEKSRDPARASALWTRAYESDPMFAPVWLQLADVHFANDDLLAAHRLYEQVAACDAYDDAQRAIAGGRAQTLAGDPAVVSGEIRPVGAAALARARMSPPPRTGPVRSPPPSGPLPVPPMRLPPSSYSSGCTSKQAT
jgi:hypothetical protein